MAATGWGSHGAMGWHPYANSSPMIVKIRDFPNSLYPRLGGRWVHNPIHVAHRAFNGAGLASAIGTGNFMTRNFRQKPIVGLQKAEHKRRPPQVGPKPSLATLYEQQLSTPIGVSIPTVSARRTKSYSPKNKIFATNKAMPYRRTYKSKTPHKKATNSKNKSNRKKKMRPKTPVKVLAKQVKAIQKSIATVKSRHIYKKSLLGNALSLVGRCNHVSLPANFTTYDEQFCANLRFFDPANPGTLVTANPNTGTYARDITFKNVYAKLHLRNNYQVPARIKVYLCKVKVDTSDSVVTTYTSAIADQVINASVDETDMLIHITDVARVKDMWEVDCVLDRVLEPGQEASVSHSTGPYDFDPSHVDQFSDTYQKAFKAFEFVLRVEGVLGHDTTVTTEQTTMLAGVDIERLWKVDIEYNAGGADLDDIYISEGRAQAFSNAGVVSLKPVADNISYSLA